MCKRKLEAEAVEAAKFLWKRKHFEDRSWKWKQTRKRLTLYGAGSESKKYSTAYIPVRYTHLFVKVSRPEDSEETFSVFE